jgi:hypothetical protein
MLRHIGIKITAATLSILLAACGGGGGGSTPSTATSGGVTTGAGTTGAGNTNGNTTGNTTGTPSGTTTAPAFAYDETARFYRPTGITSNAAGELFVAELGSGTVRKIALDGSVSTLPGNYPMTQPGVSYMQPGGINVDRAGNLYVVTSEAIYKVDPSGRRETFATETGTMHPTLDAQGNLYFLRGLSRDTGFRWAIYRVTQDGLVSIVYEGPVGVTIQGLAIDPAGTLYTIMKGFPEGRIIKIVPGGAQTDWIPFTFQINPGDNTPATTIANMTFDAAGNLYVAHHREQRFANEFWGSGMSIEKVTPAGVLTRLRTGPPGGTGAVSEIDADKNYSVSYITAAPDGNLYATYRFNHTVYRISQSGQATLVAGKPGEEGTSD